LACSFDATAPASRSVSAIGVLRLLTSP
jgi:hypothetical protein